MIKINLADRKTAGFVEGGVLNKKMNIDLGMLKEIPIFKIAGTIIVFFAANIVLDNYKEDLTKEVSDKIQVLKLEESRLQRELNQKKQLETIKQSLEADEFTMRTKIETIEKLGDGRDGSAEMLAVFARMLPKEVWFTDLQVKESNVSIKGGSIDLNQVSELMQALGSSTYFTDVRLIKSTTKSLQSGIEGADFEIAATRREAQ